MSREPESVEICLISGISDGAEAGDVENLFATEAGIAETHEVIEWIPPYLEEDAPEDEYLA